MDIRTVRTKAALRKATISYMKAKPANTIQVTEICRMAGVDRTTFYTHYKSVDGIIAELEQEQIERFRDILQQENKTGEELLRDILDSIEYEKELYRIKNGGIVPETFRTGIIAVAKEHGLQAWKERLPNTDECEAELIYEALLAGALQAAMAESEEKDRETVIRTIMDMLDSYVKAHE